MPSDKACRVRGRELSPRGEPATRAESPNQKFIEVYFDPGFPSIAGCGIPANSWRNQFLIDIDLLRIVCINQGSVVPVGEPCRDAGIGTSPFWSCHNTRFRLAASAASGRAKSMVEEIFAPGASRLLVSSVSPFLRLRQSV